MTWTSRPVGAAALITALLFGGCAGSPQQATTTKPQLSEVSEAYLFSSAEVNVETSEGSFTATELDPIDESGYDPADEGTLEVSGSYGKGVIITWKAGTEADVKDAFVRVDLGSVPAVQYPDMFHTQCTVTVPTRQPEQVSGSFTCNDLPNFDDGDKSLAHASGTFSAHR